MLCTNFAPMTGNANQVMFVADFLGLAVVATNKLPFSFVENKQMCNSYSICDEEKKFQFFNHGKILQN